MYNTIIKWISFAVVLGSIYACSEEERPHISLDSIPPQPVSEVEIKNIPGGAILKFQLPDDEDLLYVKALYDRKGDGQLIEARGTMYSDTLTIKGFGTSNPQNVRLIAVDRSENESTPVDVTINPLEPPVISIGKSLRLVEDFGGVHAYWDNQNRAEISVIILKEDHNKEFSPIDVFYSTMVEGDGASRGMDTIPSNFKAYVQDRWENRSEIIEASLTPLFETQFDRMKFQPLFVAGDEPSAWGWVLQNLFDGNQNSGFHTANGSGRWPQSATIDMGQVGKISRVKVWQRDENRWLYQHGNVKRFEVWGSKTNKNMDNWDNWTKLMECTSIKPSDLPMGQYSGEDAEWARAGEEFLCSPEMPEVRYLRIKFLETWSGGDFVHIMELEVYGDNRY